MKLRKLWPLFGLIAMSIAGNTAHADTYNSRSDSMSSSSPGSMRDSKGTGAYERGTYREITPTAGPRVAAGADVFITANFIWFKAVQEGTTYAATNTNIGTFANTDNTISVLSKGKTQPCAHDWAPGFKVGLGLNLAHDGWDVFAQYTWLRPSNSNAVNATAGELQPQVATMTDEYPMISDLNRASGKWNLRFNVIDAELGRNFYVSQYLTMRPFIGLKATWQTNNTSAKYFIDLDNNHFDVDTVPLDGPYRLKNELSVWGIGVRGGLQTAWYMSKSWSIFGNLAYTAMWADYTKIERTDKIANPSAAGNGDTAITYNSKCNSHYSVKNVLELELGLRWEMWFNDDNYHFAIQAGWEEQVWSNWYTALAQGAPETWNNLSLHGLNLKARFDF